MKIPRRKFLGLTLAAGAGATTIVRGLAVPATAASSADLARNSAPIDPARAIPAELRGPLEQLARMGGPQSVGPDNIQAFRAHSPLGGPKPTDVPTWKRVLVPGRGGAPPVPVFVIDPDPQARNKPALLHIHGGGYVFGTAESEIAALQPVSTELGCVIVTVEYRLAPETRFPGSLEDNYAALSWMVREAESLGIDRSRIALKGESAGGGHAAMLAIAVRDRGEFAPCAQVLIYPMLDDRTGSTRPVAGGIGAYIWNAASNRFGWSSLLGQKPGLAHVPKGSVPGRVANLAGLPPTFIGVGSVDLFVDEDIDYARKLVDAGVPTKLLLVPGGYHAFDVIAPAAAASQEFRAAWISFLRERLAPA